MLYDGATVIDGIDRRLFVAITGADLFDCIDTVCAPPHSKRPGLSKSTANTCGAIEVSDSA